MDWISAIKTKAQTGKPIVQGGRAEVKLGFDKLVFAPSQLAKRPRDYFREEISSKTRIGELELEIPILIGAMSFGALSKSAKLALAKASILAGTAANTGEGGMLPEERQEAKKLIVQYSTGRFGITEDVLKQADAIEIKLGQGAKPGQGGLLPAEKVTPEIAKVRHVELGKAVHSPPAHPDIHSWEDLKEKIKWLKELTGKPVIVKLAAGDLEADLPLIVKAGPDAIAIDGRAGGTGAAPQIMLEDFGIPTLVALAKARQILDRLEAKQKLLIGGGLSTGGDVAKCLALGADAVFMGIPLLISMGCIYCRLCHLGKCPVGLATQDPELEKKLDPKAAEKAANFLKATAEEVKMAAAALG
ncbi:MAG: FMN-binding glutamate synthase family protein, partial [Candidatus Aenigmatarchaeota archaeon]